MTGSSLEGDGWVNWSGLATLLAEIGEAFTRALDRLDADGSRCLSTATAAVRSNAL